MEFILWSDKIIQRRAMKMIKKLNKVRYLSDELKKG